MAKSIKNYPEYYKELQIYMQEFGQANPSTMGAFSEMHKASTQEASLSTKHKELIALGIAIAVRCDGCIVYHTADALRAGATKEEIIETIGVAIVMGGGPAVIYGAQAFEALKQFQNHPKDWAIKP